MTTEVHHQTREIRRILDNVDRAAVRGDFIDQWRQGEVIFTDEAARIAGVNASTIRRWASDTEGTPYEIGVGRGDVWIISLTRLLRLVERMHGFPARVEAEARVQRPACAH